MQKIIYRFGLLSFVALESCYPGENGAQADAGKLDRMNVSWLSVKWYNWNDDKWELVSYFG